jgi:hypothetical protein
MVLFWGIIYKERSKQFIITHHSILEAPGIRILVRNMRPNTSHTLFSHNKHPCLHDTLMTNEICNSVHCLTPVSYD